MAFRATNRWRAVLSRLGQSRPFASSTTPKFATMSHSAAHHAPDSRYAVAGEYAPIYVMAGMVTVAVAMAVHTMKQQLVHSPGVSVKKKRRESVVEVDDPDMAVADASKFLKKSFLRKVAHIQEHNRTLPDPTRANALTNKNPLFNSANGECYVHCRPQDAETLKTVGVNPRRH
ncbi:hypothetical protein DKX38_004814 [Salix brachista]|uniref:Uncharacterized protein n=1 Tax=Salix brachista TaxID=2182728 RepID=A0A5N5NAV2_9ROSI|nr:hypothetical protein DKX38_004814 [Salix brachista]